MGQASRSGSPTQNGRVLRVETRGLLKSLPHFFAEIVGQYRYACLSCGYHRVTEVDKPKIEADIKNLEQDLEQANNAGQERRVTEINRLLELLKTRLKGLDQLKNLREGVNDE